MDNKTLLYQIINSMDDDQLAALLAEAQFAVATRNVELAQFALQTHRAALAESINRGRAQETPRVRAFGYLSRAEERRAEADLEAAKDAV